MKRLLLLSVFLAITAQISFAQTTGIKGRLIDSSDKRSLSNAVIAILKQQDSALINFTRAKENGSFELSIPDTGKLIVMVTHPYFADFFDSVTQKTGQVIDLGNINMLSRIKLLEEVIVKSGAPIRIKGDTTVYTADSFKVREGANVEELLRKLPGIQVDRSGQITAMGEKVERVLVDGEEFFGNDPGIATKNLRADNVKEVEVYKAKSDQATFTGIDDGQSKQTINLKLKEDKKRGYFGKIEVGGGIKGKKSGEDDKFNNALMLNAFKGKRKIAAYGIMSNTGTLNLNWQDEQKYGGSGNNIDITDAGDVSFNWDGGSWNSSSGIPTNWNGGLHYSNKFNQDKQSIATGYKFAKINSPGYRETNSTIYFPNDSSTIDKSFVNTFSSVIKHNLNGVFETKIDSMNTIKLRLYGNKNLTQSNFSMDRSRQNNTGAMITKEQSHGSNDQDNSSASGNILLMHKFKKLYRTISLNVGLNYSESKGDNISYSLQDYYKNNAIDSSKLRDNNILNNNQGSGVNARIAYTEPIIKDVYLELSYGAGISKSDNDRRVLDRQKNNELIDSLSNHYEYNNVSNSPGVNLRINKKKYNLSFGNTTSFTSYTQKDITRGPSGDRKYNFANFSPNANLNYKIKPSENLYLNYWGNSSAPSLNDLQPIRDYSDVLNIKEGNPYLKPSFRHSFGLWYNSFKLLKERQVWANIRYSFTQNAFTDYSEYRADSRRYYHTVNTNGIANFYSNLEYGFKLSKAGIRLGFGGGYNFNRNVNFIYEPKSKQTLKNITVRNTYSFRPRINKEIPDKLDISFSPNISYNTSNATVSSTANAKYWSGGFDIWGNWQLPKDFELSTNVDANYTQKFSNFSANNFTIWNASASKKFHKKEFELRLSVNDILNQNRGYDRNFNSNTFSETYRTTLKRFWMLSFIWNITKNNGGTTSAPAK